MSLALCILLAGGVVAGRVESADFTLTWRHSVEKIEWREDWRVTPEGLEIRRAVVRGSGAGMDPPADAVAVEGGWAYVPALPVVPRLALARSGVVADYTLCVGRDCRALGVWAGGIADDMPVTLAPCAP